MGAKFKIGDRVMWIDEQTFSHPVFRGMIIKKGLGSIDYPRWVVKVDRSLGGTKGLTCSILDKDLTPEKAVDSHVCSKCGLEFMNPRVAVAIDGETICIGCKPKQGAKMRKVLVIDDHYFMKGFVEKFVSDVQVDHRYTLPPEEDVMREYDALVIDGEGIGNATYRHGLEFCRQYDKPDGQAVVYCSGLHPGKEDCEILEKRGIAVVDKGGNPEKLALCVKFAMEKTL